MEYVEGGGTTDDERLWISKTQYGTPTLGVQGWKFSSPFDGVEVHR